MQEGMQAAECALALELIRGALMVMMLIHP